VNTPDRPRRLIAVLCFVSLSFRAASVHAAEASSGAGAAPVSLAPAPVPAEVAIARPSTAEIAAVTGALDKFLASADPATKAIAAKYPEMIAVRTPRANPALVPNLSPNPGIRTKHANNVALAQKGDIDLLFMGDSITDGWRSAGKEVFKKYYGTVKVGNFGIGSDTLQGVLYRLRDGEGQGFQPKAIMLMIGTNNGGALSSAEIAEGVGAIVLDMRTRFPAAKILLLAIFPRANPGDAIRSTVLGANPIIAKLHDGKNVFYMDIGVRFLAADGTLPADIMPDKLHPNAKGYEIWAEAVKDQLTALMK
jgi:lysophospholipase L1-like esterase